MAPWCQNSNFFLQFGTFLKTDIQGHLLTFGKMGTPKSELYIMSTVSHSKNSVVQLLHTLLTSGMHTFNKQ